MEFITFLTAIFTALAAFRAWNVGLQRLAYFLAGIFVAVTVPSILFIGYAQGWWVATAQMVALINWLSNLGLIGLAFCLFTISKDLRPASNNWLLKRQNSQGHSEQ